jgi:hypothetical protein
MSCEVTILDRQIAAARDRRQVATTEDEINAAEQSPNSRGSEAARSTWLSANLWD